MTNRYMGLEYLAKMTSSGAGTVNGHWTDRRSNDVMCATATEATSFSEREIAVLRAAMGY